MTKIYKATYLVTALSLASLMSVSAFAANESIGVNSAIKGDVTIQSGEQEAKQAVIKEPVLLGDVVNSNKVGSLQVLLKDQTMFTVGPDCNLTIDKFVYDPTKNSNSMTANVKKGMFRFMSGNISKSGPDSVSVDTPIASMGVRGTIAEGLIGEQAILMAQNAGVIASNAKADRDNATLFVLRGPGRKNASKNRVGEISVTSAGQTVLVKENGMAVFVADKNSPPSQPFRLLASDSDSFHAKLRTEPTGGQSYKPFILDDKILQKRPSKGSRTNQSGDEVEFFNPETDLDWPVDQEIINPNGVPVNPGICTPLNPNFPNC